MTKLLLLEVPEADTIEHQLEMVYLAHVQEQDRHVRHHAVRASKRFNRRKVGLSHRGLSAIRRRRARWQASRIERYEERAAMQPDPEPYLMFEDWGWPTDDFDEVTDSGQESCQQSGSAMVAGNQLVSGASPASGPKRLITAHSRDIRLTVVDPYEELLDSEEILVDPDDIREEYGFYFLTV